MKLSNIMKKKDETAKKPEWTENEFNVPSLFDDFVMRDLFTPSFRNNGVSTPAVNIIETSDAYRLEMVAPGMKKEAFNVSQQDGVLTVSYEHEDNRGGERRDWKYHTHEYNYHSFSRSFYLPETVESEKIEAKYTDGILNLVIPKKEEARTKPPRRISIS